MYVDANEKNTIKDDTEMIIEKTPPIIFIRSIINNYQAFCDKISILKTSHIFMQDYVKQEHIQF